MFRVPITSREVRVDTDGVTTIRLGADLPTENTYNISEVGIFSGAQNPAAGEYDSRNIFSFTAGETWEYHSDLTTLKVVTALNKVITDSLDDITNPTNTIRDLDSLDPINFIPVLQTTIDNPIFTDNPDRQTRYENCRFFNTAIAMPGDTSKISKNVDTGKLTVSTDNYGEGFVADKFAIITEGTKKKIKVTTSTAHTFLPGNYVTFDGISSSDAPFYSLLNGKTLRIDSVGDKFIYFITTSNTASEINSTGNPTVESIKKSSHIHNKNNLNVASFKNQSQNDELRLAFSVVNKVGANTANSNTPDQPYEVRIIVKFLANEGNANNSYATMEVVIPSGTSFSTNRYFVASKTFDEINKTKTAGFSWDAVTTVQIYASVVDNNNKPLSNFFVFLDGLRVENVTATNALYGLTGYTVVDFDNAELIAKKSNTKNHFQFRFDLIDSGGA
jgi:hypothetical protein